MSNHDEIIAQFTEITGATTDSAKFYLESSNWALQDALSNFLASANDSNDIGPELAASNADDASMPPLNSNREEPFDDMMASKGNKTTNSRTSRPRIATLQNMSRNSSSDEEGQAFYAGGSERSGQQVLGPPKRKNFRETLTDMFRQAQELSHENLASSSSTGPCWGVGCRLGQTPDDHAVVETEGKSERRKSQSVILKLWSQGFTIDDGELRLYEDPENKEFLETVMRGEIPSELMEMGSMVSVDVEDHRQEDFQKKVKKPQTFRGSGYTLGSPAPNVVENVVNTPQDNCSNSDNEKKASDQLDIKSDQPVTQLQIRLADGSRITPQFNLSHTVGDIRQFIETARPQYAHRTFALVSSFPTREIDDDTATIEKAGLKNAAIMQRLK